MGEIADMMLDGTLDAHTGEYIGDPCGYPRTLDRYLPWERSGPPAGVYIAPVMGLLKARGIEPNDKRFKVILQYAAEIGKKSVTATCQHIRENGENRGAFKVWLNNNGYPKIKIR
jgi:hypothetical protein